MIDTDGAEHALGLTTQPSTNKIPSRMEHTMSNIDAMPSIEAQYAEALRWAGLLWQANYPTELHGTGEAEPFHQEWRVFGPGWNGPQVATIDIDGCGASWHGPDDLWLKVIGSKTDMLD